MNIIVSVLEDSANRVVSLVRIGIFAAILTFYLRSLYTVRFENIDIPRFSKTLKTT